MLPDQQFNQIPPESRPIPEMPAETPRPKHFLFTVTILLIVTAIFAGWYFFIQQPVEEPVIESQVKTDEFAGWQTYRNEEFEFEFRYPKEWVINYQYADNGNRIYLLNPESGTGLTFVFDDDRNPKNLSVTKLFIEEKNLLSPSEDLKDYGLIDGTHALIDNDDLGVFFTGNTNLYYVTRFYRGSGPVEKEIFDQILSTLKFISSTSTDQGITTHNSGITGKVTIGPICPVMKDPPDPNCADKPYQATLRVKNSAGKVLIEEKIDTNGTFKFNLPPGEYIIEDATGSQIPFLKAVSATVSPEKYSEINLSFDSGIR